jgi:hypothetical protein
MTVQEFKDAILRDDIDTVLADILLNDEAKHVTLEQREFVKEKISEKFNVNPESIRIIIVGSAKLGFSISEKSRKELPMLPRYRSFNATSDIDIAIISQPIFELIWNELSDYSFGVPYYPWKSNKLGDYLVCGWMRPDHFPKWVRLRKCDDWWDLFSFLSSRQSLGRRKIRAGLFYNFEQLKTYQSKALQECINYEKLHSLLRIYIKKYLLN